MITTEKAYEMLPSLVTLYDKLKIDEYRKTIKSEGAANLSKEAVGVDLIKYVLKNTGLVKEEVFEIVAVFTEKTVEEVRSQSFMATVNAVRTIFADKDAIDFLTQAM